MSNCKFLQELASKGYGKYVETEKYCILYLSKPTKVTINMTCKRVGWYGVLPIDVKLVKVGNENVKLDTQRAILSDVVGSTVGEYVSTTGEEKWYEEKKLYAVKVIGNVYDRIVINKETGEVEIVW